MRKITYILMPLALALAAHMAIGWAAANESQATDAVEVSDGT